MTNENTANPWFNALPFFGVAIATTKSLFYLDLCMGSLVVVLLTTWFLVNPGLLIADDGMRLQVVLRAPATPERQQGWQTKPMYGRRLQPENQCTLMRSFKMSK